ncbi:lyase family protein, partial [Sphingobacterium daejeonense]|uniref:lyase family protein n=1 Tax=Sphingobacterium daejeonense TaxID=371142 RepID=UPI003D31190A
KKRTEDRERKDQGGGDLKLYFRSEIESIFKNTEELFNELISLSNQYKNVLMPGYTHLQIAMPSLCLLYNLRAHETVVSIMR